jgi:hypothetical protein
MRMGAIDGGPVNSNNNRQRKCYNCKRRAVFRRNYFGLIHKKDNLLTAYLISLLK